MRRTFVFLLVVVATHLASAQDLLIKDARVLTLSGPELESASVLIQGGKIAAIGSNLKVEPGTRTISAKGQVVMPAFVLAHTSEGLGTPNEAVPVTPYISVLDGIDGASNFFESCLRDGILTIHVMPGDRTVIGGIGRIIHPSGILVEDMTEVAESGMKFSLIPMTGNRAAHLAKLRAALDDAKAHDEKKRAESKLKPGELSGNSVLDLEALQVDRRKAPLVRVLKGEIPVFISCATGGDVLKAFELEKEYGLKIRLNLSGDSWRAASVIAERKVPVILSADLEREETDLETGKPVRRIPPKIFHDAGVRFAVTNAPSSLGRRYLWYQAACLVRYGLSREQALASVTSIPAEILGLGAKKGTIEVGKDADLLVLTDDPLSGRAWVECSVIGGRVAYERKKDPRLAEVFGTEAK